MISWAGFIGKLLEFTVTKLFGSKLDISLSQKRKACKAFVSLHDSIVQLELATVELLQSLKPIDDGEKQLLHSYRLAGISKRIDRASQDFLKSLNAIGPALQIYDPTLSRIFMRLRRGKKALAYGISSLFSHMVFAVHWTSENSYDYIDVTLPKDELLETDFDGLYRDVKRLADDNGVLMGEEWPQDLLENIARDGIESLTIKKTDIEAVRTLSPAIRRHLGRLRTGRDGLREFIKREFSIEDVLASTD